MAPDGLLGQQMLKLLRVRAGFAIDLPQSAPQMRARLFRVLFQFHYVVHDFLNTSDNALTAIRRTAMRAAKPISPWPNRLCCPPPMTKPVRKPIPSASKG